MDLKEKISTDIGFVTLVEFTSKIKGVLIIPFIIKSLDAAAFGAYAQMLVIVGILGLLALFNFHVGLVNYSQNEDFEMHELYTTILLFVLASGTVSGGVMALFSQQVSLYTLGASSYEGVFLIGSLLIPINIMSSMGKNYFRAVRRTKMFSLIKGIDDYLLIISVGISLFLFSADLLGVVIGIIVARGLFVIALQLYILYNLESISINMSIIEPIWNYASPLVVSSLMSNLLTTADRLLVGYFLGASAVGVYETVYRIANVVFIFLKPVALSLFPEFSNLVNQGRLDEVSKFLWNGSVYFLMLALPSIFGIYVVGEQVISIIASAEVAKNQGKLAALLTVGVTLWGLDILYGTVLKATQNTTILAYIRTGSAVFNIILNLVLIPTFGLVGAAIATIVSFQASFAITYFQVQKKIETIVKLSVLLKMAISSLSMLILLHWVPHFHFILLILIGSVWYFGILLLIGGIDRDTLLNNGKEIYRMLR